MNLVSHEEASAEACLAGLKAVLAAPGGAQLARWGCRAGQGERLGGEQQNCAAVVPSQLLAAARGIVPV